MRATLLAENPTQIEFTLKLASRFEEAADTLRSEYKTYARRLGRRAWRANTSKGIRWYRAADRSA